MPVGKTLLRLLRCVAAGVSALLCEMSMAALMTTAHAQVRPNASWQQIETQNFTIIYEAGLDSIARHTALRAELEHWRLSQMLYRPPKAKIDIVLADNMDQS